MEYYPIIKMSKILPFATTGVKLEGVMLSKIKGNKEKYCMISFMWRI